MSKQKIRSPEFTYFYIFLWQICGKNNVIDFILSHYDYMPLP